MDFPRNSLNSTRNEFLDGTQIPKSGRLQCPYSPVSGGARYLDMAEKGLDPAIRASAQKITKFVSLLPKEEPDPTPINQKKENPLVRGTSRSIRRNLRPGQCEN